jgi:hypothetical protein
MDKGSEPSVVDNGEGLLYKKLVKHINIVILFKEVKTIYIIYSQKLL